MAQVRLSDPRYVRSAERLQSAIWRMAANRPVGRITVVELCREAAITRDTFYRHASSPLELLSALVQARVRDVADHLRERAVPGLTLAESGMTALLDHVANAVEVYRNVLDPAFGAPLSPVLQGAFAAILHEGVGIDPDVLPKVLRDDVLGRDMAVAYAAAGAVGALRVWLVEEDLDPRRGAALIVAASPQFWIDSSDRRSSMPGLSSPPSGPNE